MKFKLTQVACAAGLCAIASSAMATPTGFYNDPANYAGGTANNVYDVYLAGSSAVDPALTKLIAQRCDANSLDVYRNDVGGKTYYLWTCTSDATGGKFAFNGSNAVKVAIHKNTNSSSDGTNLVANGAATALFLNPADLAPATYCNVAMVNGGGSPAYNLAVCNPVGGATTAGLPTSPGTNVQFGFSDSEPSQFNAGVAGQLQSQYPFSLVMGVPLSKGLRDALQHAQGLTVGDEGLANVPTISAATFDSIETAKFTSWSTALGLSAADLAAGGVTSDTVYRTIRSNGSGTTRAINAAYIGSNCVPGLTGIVGTPVSIVTPAAQCTTSNTLTQAGTSDDMASCLSTYDGLHVGALGYLSTDYTPVAGTDNYRFIKVDGYVPSLKNAVDGKWKAWSEGSFNYNKAAGQTGTMPTFFNSVKAASNDVTFVAGIASDLAQTTSGSFTGGLYGTLASRNNPNAFGLTPTAAFLTGVRADADVIATPYNPLTRSSSTGYNLCSEATPASGYLPR